MTPYEEEHAIPAQYIFDAHTWLEDAQHALSIFVRRAEPQTDEAKATVQYMDAARIRLRKFLKDYEDDFNELTEGLPEKPEHDEDDVRIGGQR